MVESMETLKATWLASWQSLARPRKAHRPQFPFVRLVNDGVWELNKDDIDTKRDYPSGFLKEQRVAGSFTEGVIEALRNDPELVQEIAGGIA